MAVLADLTEEERYFFALLQDQSGIDQAEFSWTDETSPDFVFRCWDYQYPWYRTRAKMQIDQCVAEGELVLTRRGHVPIEEVVVGDEVWTHRNRWRKVTYVYEQGDRDVVDVLVDGRAVLRSTPEHRVFDRGLLFKPLEETDELWVTDGQERRRKKFQLRPAGRSAVWDLEVEDDNSFVAGGVVVSNCARAIGKALDVATPILTPGGWTTMGELEAGDLVYAPNGSPVRVSRAFEPREGRPCFEVFFNTGESVVADAEHLWGVRDSVTGEACVRTTQEILEIGLRTSSQWRWQIDTAAPVAGLKRLSLPIPAWLLGYWLGDGTSRTGQITVGAQDIGEFVRKAESLGFAAHVRDPREGCSAHVVSLTAPDGTQFGRMLTAAGAKLPDRPGLDRGRKRIPDLYLLASIQDRLELLRGFMDADGTATKGKRAEFDLMDFDLAEQVISLIASLGEQPFARTEDATLNGRIVGQRRRVGWTPRRHNPFGYERKAARIALSERPAFRIIRSIVAVPTRTVRCITVDSDDHLFLAGRTLVPTHNSVGIQMRAWAFAFTNPGEEMLITAPEMIHLDPVTKNIEDRIMSARLSREFLKRSGNSNGIKHRPFEAQFRNGATIKGRIPQKDGRGVKGMHPKKLEMDEAQDYPEPGWVELGETLKYGDEDATWRSHGVSRGVRDRYYKQTQPESGWYVHRITAMHRPDWTPEERDAKAELYGSRDHPDYRRNILGLHGDASSALFVLTRLMQCVDQVQGSYYNMQEYHHVRINDEKLRDSQLPIQELLEFPAIHNVYERTWVGMDVGMTNHPSEILIFAEEYVKAEGGRKKDLPDMRLKCITRIHLERISSPDQRRVLEAIWEFYKPQAISMDRTGLGLPIYQEIMESAPAGMRRAMRPYNFSEKIVIGYEEDNRDPDDVFFYEEDDGPAEIKANVLEYSSDMLRAFVDQEKIYLPWDIDMIREFQGQTYVVTKSSTDAYGKKQFNKGKFHALDAARMAVLGKLQDAIVRQHEVANEEPVFDMFLT